MKTNYNFITFDLGGVLIEVFPQKFIDSVTSFALKPLKDLDHYADRIGLGNEKSELILQQMINDFKINLSLEKLVDKFKINYIGKKFDLMENLVDELKRRGYHISLLSNTNPIHFDYIRTIFNFDPFDKLYLSYELHLLKPDKRIFQYMIDDLGASPGEILLIDDTVVNLEAAASLGLQTLQVRPNDPDVDRIRNFFNLKN
ncbi:MAG: HAD family phosphatase [Spirochaetes bacterium]|nr:HAD family phosphatase [Spirochaetota bacterium]